MSADWDRSPASVSEDLIPIASAIHTNNNSDHVKSVDLTLPHTEVLALTLALTFRLLSPSAAAKPYRDIDPGFRPDASH